MSRAGPATGGGKGRAGAGLAPLEASRPCRHRDLSGDHPPRTSGSVGLAQRSPPPHSQPQALTAPGPAA